MSSSKSLTRLGRVLHVIENVKRLGLLKTRYSVTTCPNQRASQLPCLQDLEPTLSSMILAIGNLGKLVLKVESCARNILSLTQDHRRSVIMGPASHRLTYDSVYTSDLIGVAILSVS
jgi:hypothetical protein